LLYEVLTLLMGFGAGEILGASERIERALGRLLLSFGRVYIQSTGDGVDPIVEFYVKVDLRKLKASLAM